jgi:hypothetical protein
MKLKHALMATTAAILLTAGGFAQTTAVAQQNAPQTAPGAPQNAPASRDSGTSTMPAPDAPGSASGGLTASGNSGDANLSSSTLHEIKDAKIKVSTLNGVTVKDLNAMAIYGSDGKKIGEVDRVLGDSANAPKAVAVDAGGFLGLGKNGGKHEVVFPLSQLSKGDKAKQLKTALSKEDIKNLETWNSAGSAKKGSRTASGAGGQPATSIPKR